MHATAFIAVVILLLALVPLAAEAQEALGLAIPASLLLRADKVIQ